MFTDIIKILLCCQTCERYIKQCLEIVNYDPREAKDMEIMISSGHATVNDITVELRDIFIDNGNFNENRYQEMMARMVDLFQRCVMLFTDSEIGLNFEIEWMEIVQGPITIQRKFVYVERIRKWFKNTFGGEQGASGSSSEEDGDSTAFIGLREDQQRTIPGDYDSENTEALQDAEGAAFVSLRESPRRQILIRSEYNGENTEALEDADGAAFISLRESRRRQILIRSDYGGENMEASEDADYTDAFISLREHHGLEITIRDDYNVENTGTS